MDVHVLFLGGPLDGQRRPVRKEWTPGQRPHLPNTLPAVDERLVPVDPPSHSPWLPRPAIVVYELHHVAPGGIFPPGQMPMHPVYVAPDYDGPPRW